MKICFCGSPVLPLPEIDTGMPATILFTVPISSVRFLTSV